MPSTGQKKVQQTACKRVGVIRFFGNAVGKRLLRTLVALAGIGMVVVYTMCGSSCTYLAGTIAGVEVKYAGIAFITLFILLNLMKQDRLCLFLSALGLGVELFLLSYQVRTGVYCPYCLIFAGIVAVLFALSYEKLNKRLIAGAVVLGFLFVLVWFEGVPLALYDRGVLLPSFGKGKITIRLYTDYFCGPCNALEPRLEPLITDLVRKNVINVTFIDTPIHQHTNLYAGYFLSMLSNNRKFDDALRARGLLFSAARQGITDKEQLKSFLKEKNVNFSLSDNRDAFGTYSRYILEDAIHSTPTLVVVTTYGKKIFYSGSSDILKAMMALRSAWEGGKTI